MDERTALECVGWYDDARPAVRRRQGARDMNDTHDQKYHGVDFGTMLSGLVYIGLGVIVWQHQKGSIDAYDYVVFWPALLVLWGLSGVLSKDSDRSGFWAWLLIAVGSMQLLYNFGIAGWPVVLIGAGVVVLFRGLRESRVDADNGGA